MIKSFRHKGLKSLFVTGRTSKVRHELQARIIRRLDVMDAAGALDELNIPSFDFHGLEGKPKRYTIHVNGPLCLTFEWKDGDIFHVDLESDHWEVRNEQCEHNSKVEASAYASRRGFTRGCPASYG